MICLRLLNGGKKYIELIIKYIRKQVLIKQDCEIMIRKYKVFIENKKHIQIERINWI